MKATTANKRHKPTRRKPTNGKAGPRSKAVIAADFKKAAAAGQPTEVLQKEFTQACDAERLRPITITATEFADLAAGANDRCDPRGILEAALEHAGDTFEVIATASGEGSSQVPELALAASARAHTVVKVVRRMCGGQTEPEAQAS